MEENKNEEVVNEAEATKVEPVVEEAKAEEATENTKADEPKKDGYHLIMENFKPAVIFAAIYLAVRIFGFGLGLFVGGNLPWAILNTLLCIGFVAIGVIELIIFLKKTKPAMNKDIASFIVSLACFILAFISGARCAWDGIHNLIGFINELASK